MDLHHDVLYRADPQKVFAILTDKGFLEKVAEATGSLHYDVAVEAAGVAVRTRLHRVLPAVVPDFLRSMVGETLDVVETTVWSGTEPDGSRSGELTAAISGTPVRVSGRARLQVQPPGTRHTVQLEVRAGVPFVGRRIEASAAEGVQFALHKQTQLMQTRLKSRPSPPSG